ncbi:hypothetical protein [Clostridium thermobutyricum]|uniref:hypothetical protein n=1 Tax=Clostridium thermobutyricum TaxID=29372 RepID=UPI0029434BC6|nr:hypothetical protein [Clostridium thermobutyricum]
MNNKINATLILSVLSIILSIVGLIANILIKPISLNNIIVSILVIISSTYLIFNNKKVFEKI